MAQDRAVQLNNILWFAVLAFSLSFPVYIAYEQLQTKRFDYHTQTQDPFIILSFATNAQHPMHRLLKKSSTLPIISLGNNQKWRWHRQKLTAVRNYLRKRHLQSSNTIILFVDGYDTFFTKNKGNLIETFKMFNKPLVISAEKGCWPRQTPACFDPTNNPYPASPSPFRYVNSGTYMGYAWAVYQMLDETLKKHPEQKDDQYLLHDYFLNHPGEIALDYHQKIFSLLFKTTLIDFQFHPETKELTNLITNTKPFIIHGNGGPAVKAVFLNLYQNYGKAND